MISVCFYSLQAYLARINFKGMFSKLQAYEYGSVAKFFSLSDNLQILVIAISMISFKGAHFPKDVILYAVFFYVRYGVSYRDLEAIMEERGVKVDHSSLSRWVINYSSSLTMAAKSKPRVRLILIQDETSSKQPDRLVMAVGCRTVFF